MNKFLIGLLLGLVSVFIISCNNTSVTSTPDDDLISNNIYQNNYFSFSLPLPENWAIADNETEEKLSQTVKEVVVKNDPELEVEVDKAAKRSYQLLLISQHPIKTGDASNAVILITAENVSQFTNIKNGADYLAQSTKLLMENLPHDPSYEIYEYTLDSKPFHRTDLVLNASTGPFHQSYISTVSGEYALSFALSGQTNEEIRHLEEIIQSGNFESLSTEVIKSEQRPSASLQGIIGLLLMISPIFITLIWKWLQRGKAETEEEDIEENN